MAADCLSARGSHRDRAVDLIKLFIILYIRMPFNDRRESARDSDNTYYTRALLHIYIFMYIIFAVLHKRCRLDMMVRIKK